jgi:hypothetical protein
MKEEKRKMIEVSKIRKVLYRDTATLVYLKNEVFICEPNSEKYLPNGIVEYTLKDLSEKGKCEQYGKR